MVNVKNRDWLILLRGKLTQEQTAKLAGISRSAYSNIELGIRDPSVQTAKKIAKELAFDWKLFFEEKCFVTKNNKSA